MRKLILIIAVALVSGSCNKEPDLVDTDLESGIFFDQSIYQPEKHLVSVAKPNPTALEAQIPVVIAIHGYGATNFEWDEFRAWSGTRTDFSISQVLLGGHGRDYQTFKNSSWKDWRQPIINEFEALERMGYNNISFAGSSTGSTLILEMLANGYFDGHIKPKHVFLIDPIIVPSDKLLTLVGVLGPIIGYTTVDNTKGEAKYYYHYRPYETLQELRNVINVVRKDLQNGFTLPPGCSLNVFKSEKDDVSDPVSAVMIYKGIKTNTGGNVDVSMVPSNLHVYTRLAGRDISISQSASDVQNQTSTFNKIANLLISK